MVPIIGVNLRPAHYEMRLLYQLGYIGLQRRADEP